MKNIIVDTAFGPVRISASESGLAFVSFAGDISEIGPFELDIARDAVFSGLPTRIKRYFNGELVTFPDRLDLSRATPFQAQVWRAVRSIPYGEVRSYSWIARQIGKPGSSRAVGRALGQNPFLIVVPCHRVVAADGSLGGFTGGLELKSRLLSLEGSNSGFPPQIR